MVERAAKKVPSGASADIVSLRRLVGELQLAADQNARASETFATVLKDGKSAGKTAAVADACDRLRGLLADVRRGRVTGLPEWFKTAADALARPLPADTPLAIPGLVVAAEVQQSLANQAAAATLLVQAVALAGSMSPADVAVLADVTGRAAAAQIAAGKAADARKVVEGRLPALEKSLGGGDPRVASLKIVHADTLLRAGETAKAIDLAGKALDRGLPRPDSGWEERVTAIYDHLAAAAAGRSGDDLRERFVAARASQFGADHPHVAAACRMFASARLTAGDWPAAVGFCTRAVEIERSRQGEDRAGEAASLVLLAHAQRAAGQSDLALDTASQGAAAWERIAAANHPGAITAAEVLLAAKLQAGVKDGVVELLERLSAADASGDSGRRSAHLVRLADVTARRDAARARKLLEQALELPCWKPGPELGESARRRLAFTAALAAHAYSVLDDPDAAKESLQRARALALEADDPRPLLERIDHLADRGDTPAAER